MRCKWSTEVALWMWTWHSAGGGKEQHMGPVLIPQHQRTSCHLLVS